MPPWIWIARSQARTATSAAYIFAIVASAPHSRPWLSSHAARWNMRRAASSSVAMSARPRVVERALVGRDAAAERRGAAQDALVVERGQELVEAAPFLAEHGVRGQADAVVEDRVRVLDGGD